MRAKRAVALLSAVGLSVGLPASAGARTSGQSAYVPGGAAGASQYFEDLPTANGNVRPPASGQAASGKTLDHVSRSAATGATRVAKLGALGQTALDFAEATAPTRSDATTATGKSGTNSDPAAAKASAQQAASAAAQSLPSAGSASGGLASFLAGQDQGGLGLLLPLVLGASLIGAVVFALRRRRGPAASA